MHAEEVLTSFLVDEDEEEEDDCSECGVSTEGIVVCMIELSSF